MLLLKNASHVSSPFQSFLLPCHPAFTQVQYLHQFVQARLYEATQPLHDLYNVLHAFCLSLQLEVLFSQTMKLQQERLGDTITIDSYAVGSSLQLSYWREKAKLLEGEHAGSDLGSSHWGC